MSVSVSIISDLVKGDKFGVDDEGRTTCTRNFIVTLYRSFGTQLTYATKMAYILNSGIPKSGDYLFSDGVPSGCTNPTVNSIEVTPERDDDPHTYNVTIEYGYKDSTGTSSSQDDDDGDEPDVDRERYPWEQNAEVDLNFGNSREVVPEFAGYAGCLSLNEVVSERGKASAITTSTNKQPLKNTAGDSFKDPPTKSIRSGQITITFNVLTDDSYWDADDFADSMFKVNRYDMDLTIDGSSLFTIPAGCSQLIGFSSTSQTYTESKKWRSGKDHPFGKMVNGRVLRNTTKGELTAYRYWSYKKVTITLEYREEGYIHYIENMGMREQNTVEGFLASGETLTPIKDPISLNDITEPWKLDNSGKHMQFNSSASDVYFQKYVFYDFSAFSFLLNIPWQYRGSYTL